MGDMDFSTWDAMGEGYRDARDGDPLFPDADSAYSTGWCYFYGVENPYASPKRNTGEGE